MAGASETPAGQALAAAASDKRSTSVARLVARRRPRTQGRCRGRQVCSPMPDPSPGAARQTRQPSRRRGRRLLWPPAITRRAGSSVTHCSGLPSRSRSQQRVWKRQPRAEHEAEPMHDRCPLLAVSGQTGYAQSWTLNNGFQETRRSAGQSPGGSTRPTKVAARFGTRAPHAADCNAAADQGQGSQAISMGSARISSRDRIGAPSLIA